MESEESFVKEESKWRIFNTVTPLSKSLAFTMFVLLPFLGGWVGYIYAPEKVIEVEKIEYRSTEALIKGDVDTNLIGEWIIEKKSEFSELENLSSTEIAQKYGINFIENYAPWSFEVFDTNDEYILFKADRNIYLYNYKSKQNVLLTKIDSNLTGGGKIYGNQVVVNIYSYCDGFGCPYSNYNSTTTVFNIETQTNEHRVVFSDKNSFYHPIKYGNSLDEIILERNDSLGNIATNPPQISKDLLLDLTTDTFVPRNQIIENDIVWLETEILKPAVYKIYFPKGWSHNFGDTHAGAQLTLNSTVSDNPILCTQTNLKDITCGFTLSTYHNNNSCIIRGLDFSECNANDYSLQEDFEFVIQWYDSFEFLLKDDEVKINGIYGFFYNFEKDGRKEKWAVLKTKYSVVRVNFFNLEDAFILEILKRMEITP